MAKDEINAFLGAGTTYEGNLNFQGSVRIDGMFTGEIKSEGTLIVGKDARVDGDVQVGQLILSGNIDGRIFAEQKVVLHKTANLVGSLSTPVLVIEEGAKVEGQVTMQSASSEPKKTEGSGKSQSSSSFFSRKPERKPVKEPEVESDKTLTLGAFESSDGQTEKA